MEEMDISILNFLVLLFILPIENTQCSDLLMCLFFVASFISPEKGRKMLPTPVGNTSGTSLLGPSLLDGNSRDSFVSRSLADVAEVCQQITLRICFLLQCWKLQLLGTVHQTFLRYFEGRGALTPALQLSRRGLQS